MEHVISPVTEQLIRVRLGDPPRSPFGYPIPGGREAEISRRTLADLDDGESAVIERVFEEDQDLLRFFCESGLQPNAVVRLQRHEPARGTLELGLRGGTLLIGYPAAHLVWVRAAPPNVDGASSTLKMLASADRRRA